MKNSESNDVNVLYIEDMLTNYNGVKDLLSRHKEYKLKHAVDLKDAEQELQTGKFGIIILDLGLPPDPKNFEPAIEFMLKVKINYPEIAIVIFSTITHMELDNVEVALQSGISYIVKEDIKKGDDLQKILSLAREGSAVYTQATASTFSEIFQNNNKSRIFTLRETEVASLVHEGLTNKQIARRLGISEFHARDLVSKVYQKSNTQSRAEFAVWYERYKIKNSKT